MTGTLHDSFLQNALKHPEAPAVYTDAGVLTYGELDERSAALAERLAAEGAGPGVPVGICVERTPDLLVGLYGILRSGACYLPLDPGYPAERLDFMIRDSGTKLLLTTAASRPNVPAGPTVLVLGDTVATEPGEQPEQVVPEDTAYLIYTSGSTGRPKGVAIRHSGCAAMSAEMDRILADCDLSVVAAASSICFDMSVMEIFHTLSGGGAIVLVPSAVHLPEAKHADKITHLNAIPSVMSVLLDAGGLPPNLRAVVLGGEPVRRKLVDRVYQETGAQRVFNAYGPTEGTVFCSFKLVPRDGDDEPTLGPPSAHARVYVLGQDLKPVPAGEPGELFLGGAGLASGYVNRPDTTAERFLPDPFRPGDLVYRSGDMVRFTADGELEFLGRTDQQVKIRGYRIELEEVEARLTGCPQVREAAAAVRDGRLVGYAVPAGEARTEAGFDVGLQAAVTSKLRAELPDYMIPEVIVFLPALPTAPGGKLDRAALPEPPAAAEKSGPFEAAGTPTEVALAEIWGELLDLEPGGIGVRDAFYDLGGNSLLLVRLSRMTSRRFGRRIGVADLFRFRDIHSLAAWLDQDDGDATPEVVESARRRASARRAILQARSTPAAD
ncbi:MAG TPA: non-ribosomal peptide synthetase [Actinocrinis sp.]|nr:non-ribosomal peptide synthetase [Actinocrinis sp.]